MERIRWLLATCGGCGYLPFVPGTAGALWGIAIYVPIGLGTDEPLQSALLAGALLLVSWATFSLSRWSERFFGEKDSSRFVTDEVAGFLMTVLLFRLPDVGMTVLFAFPVTRIIDVLKFPPAKRLERLPGGWGVLADDLLGSFYAAMLLHLAFWLLSIRR